MAFFETVRGVVRTLFWLTKEEFDSMDHKLMRIGAGAIGFAIAAAFWYFIMNRFSPF